jgi:hypothetical protein
LADLRRIGPAFHRFMRWSDLLDLVDAGGEAQQARVNAVVAELEEVANRGAPPYLCLALTCGRPLRAPDEEAEERFGVALALESRSCSFLFGRTLLSLGRRLRRGRRSADSRPPLREAIDLFDALGATHWRSRARRELRATGEQVSGRTPDARDRLTHRSCRSPSSPPGACPTRRSASASSSRTGRSATRSNG